MSLLKKINNKIINSYVEHNKRYFKKITSDQKILVEFNAFQSTHVAFSYLANVLSSKYNASIQPFFNYTILSAPAFPNYLSEIKWYLSKKINFFNHKIYNSFGSLPCLKPKISKRNLEDAKLIKKEIFKKINNKNEILEITYKGILVGDLLYDTYLKAKKKPTIDIKSDEFNIFSEEFFGLCEFWIEYFKDNRIKAIITSHTVYSYAIPSRIAIHNDIDAFGCTSRHINKLKRHQFRMHANTNEYEKIFESLDEKTQKDGIKKAKETLENRAIGKITTNAGYFGNVKISPFNKKISKSEIIQDEKIKVLILPHDFFDAVHFYGNGIFPDFYEWLKFLGDYSKKNKRYSWYIKLRPDYKGKYVDFHKMTEAIVDKFLINNPQINKISNNYSLHQIKDENIDFVLTVHGTAALEFALIDGPVVINASKNNPHFNYNFSLSPKNFEEYIATLNNLKNIKLKKRVINLEEIYKYYFIRHFYNDKNWLLDQNKLMETFEKWDNQFSENFYLYWMENFTKFKHENIISRLDRFIQSKDMNINIKIK